MSGKLLTIEDIQRLEIHQGIKIQTKNLWTDEEVANSLEGILQGEIPPGATSAIVKHALLFLQQNFSRKISRAEIAQWIGVSENYLSEVFNKELGLSPWDYLTRYRIQQAKILMRTSNENITSIAFQVGYDDPAYFSRVFRKETGFSPRDFRAKK